MASTIDNLVDLFTAHLAHTRGQPAAELRPFVRAVFKEAQREHLAAGAPLGLSDDAFLVWFDQRGRVAKTA